MAEYCVKCGRKETDALVFIRRVTMYSHANDVNGTDAVDPTLCRSCEGKWKCLVKKWLAETEEVHDNP